MGYHWLKYRFNVFFRFFLAKDLQWEFSMLDRQGKGSITVRDAMFLFKVVHGEYFSMEKFNGLMSKRLSNECDVTFQQIEVELCDIPTYEWIKQQMDADLKIEGFLLEYFKCVYTCVFV